MSEITMKKSLRPLFLVVIVLLFYSSAVYAVIFKCQNANGEVEYADSPCGADATIIKPHTIKKPDNHAVQRREKTRRLLDAYQEERRIKREKSAESKQEKETRRINCNNARDRLQGVLNARRLYKLDDEGNRVVYSDAQRDQATAKARENVAYWCD